MRRLGNSNRHFGVVAVVAVVLAAALIGASQLSARREPRTTGTPGTAASAVHAASPSPAAPFAGIPQSGAALGSPAARVTLVEYADLQCPYCGQWAR